MWCATWNWEVRDHDQSAEHLEKRRAMTRLARDGDGLIFAVELPDPAGGHSRVIGDMSVFLKSAADAQLEVGWVFHPAAHGHGLATEAALAIFGLCFDSLGAHRVFAELDPRNEASAHLCERLGMRQEAHLAREPDLQGRMGRHGVLRHPRLGVACAVPVTAARAGTSSPAAARRCWR